MNELLSGDWLSSINLITAAVFIALSAFFIFSAILLRRLTRDPIREQLEATSLDERGSVVGGVFLEGLASQLPTLRADDGALDRELGQAGFYEPTARRDFLALRNGLILLVVIASGLMAVLIGPERQDLVVRVLIGGAVLAALAWGVPRLMLRSRAAARVQRIRLALPNALDMLTMCMTGGLGFPEALEHVSREIRGAHPDLAVELAIIRKQAELGSLQQALQQFALRIDTDEIVSMAALVGYGQRLGIGLVSSMQDFADSIRLKWRHSAEERANRAAVALLLPVVFFLLPSAFILMWGPSVLELWTFIQQFEGAADISLESLTNP